MATRRGGRGKKKPRRGVHVGGGTLRDLDRLGVNHQHLRTENGRTGSKCGGKEAGPRRTGIKRRHAESSCL